MIYQINDGSKSFGLETVFEHIQFEINNTEKIAIVGRNGCGKTTLLKVISGEIKLDDGTIHKANKTSVGYLKQQPFADDALTVNQEFNKIYEDLLKIKAELDEIAKQMETTYSQELMNKYSRLQSEFEQRDGYTYQQEQLTVFTKFGFSLDDLNRPLNTFSGGQQTRIALVKLLLSKPDILLLDEPTNHLDMETIEWLEGYLRKYPKAVVMVSHDRMFLDHIAQEIIDMEYGSLKRYKGNYSTYLTLKAQDQQRQQQAFDRQQKDIERLEELIEKFRYKKNKAAFAQSKIKYLDRMERVNAPKKSQRNFKVSFKSAIRGGNRVLEVDNLTIGYDTALCTVNLEVLRGQRIAIIGPNGHGKSTFVKTLMNIVPAISGEFLFGHQIEIGYFDQQLAMIDSNKTVLDDIWDEYPEYDRTQIRTVLGSFLFSADDVFKTVNVLSGGEKVRLTLAKLMLKQANCLILDEPTNHLDILGKEALENALKDYDGTLLLVSHDRYLIDKLATAILVIADHKAVYYPLTYDEYVNRHQTTVKKEVEQIVKKDKVKPKNNKNQIAKLEKQIDTKEKELEALRDLRFEEEYYHDYQKMEALNRQIDDVHNEIAHLMTQWEECHEDQ